MNYSFFRKKIASVDTIVCEGNPGDPIIICCHGYGANAENMSFFPSQIPFTTCKPTWIFPHGIVRIDSIGIGRAWFELDIDTLMALNHQYGYSKDANIRQSYTELFSGQLDRPYQALGNLIEELNQPTQNIVIGGFSQGAMLTTHTLLHARKSYRGGMILSGCLLESQGWEDQAKVVEATPILQTHGLLDDIVAYGYAHELYEMLVFAGFSGDMISFSGGHEISRLSLKAIQWALTSWLS